MPKEFVDVFLDLMERGLSKKATMKTGRPMKLESQRDICQVLDNTQIVLDLLHDVQYDKLPNLDQNRYLIAALDHTKKLINQYKCPALWKK